jgi:tRNA U34 5-methylaminomethyl-2-thiouridine-forming methyltransferase MnmC
MTPIITDDGSLTIHSERYGETYHSRFGAVAEAEHVFLRASGVFARLAAGEATAVLEVGFGTGLNFLVTANAALAAGAPLAYTALEHDLMSAEVLEALDHGAAIGAADLAASLTRWRRTLPEKPPAGRYDTRLAPGITLTLLIGDASGAALPDATFDAVYQDAFSPKANPELWTEAFFARLAAAMRPGARLATYSASGDVRRAMAAARLHPERVPGPPAGKRVITVARRIQ